jgi:hypothetical protein
MSSTPARSTARSRRPAFLLVAVTAVVAPLVASGVLAVQADAAPARAVPLPVHRAAAADLGAARTIDGPAGSGLSVDVTPADLTGIRAGDVVHLHFSGLKPGQFLRVGTCAGDMPPLADLDPSALVLPSCLAQLNTGLLGALDADLQGPGVSTMFTGAFARTDGTVEVNFLIGRGESITTATYRRLDGTQSDPAKIVCDDTHPCRLGFEVLDNVVGSAWADVTSLEFSPADRSTDAGGCSGLGPNTVTAYGPERLQTLFSALNRTDCEATPGPLPVSYVPSGEADQLDTVGVSADIAVAGSGLLASHKAPDGALLVPFAVNSVALAQFGGRPAESNTTGQVAFTADKLPSLDVAPSDLAGIVLHNFNSGTQIPLPEEAAQKNPVAIALKSRGSNPDSLNGFDPSLFGLPMNVAPTVTYSLGPDSTPSILSAYLVAKQPDAWVFSHQPANDVLTRSGKAVGKLNAFDTLKDNGVGDNPPSLTSQVSSVGGLFTALFLKDLPNSDPNGGGPYAHTCPITVVSGGGVIQDVLGKGCLRFAVMDSGTAGSLGLTSSSVAVGSGFVAPDATSLAAAAAGTLNADGYYESTAADAYPLSFLEYAVVPKAPLLDDGCKPRTGPQQQLKDFLGYLTTDGQSVLPAGFAPLPAALKAQAAAQIALLGTGKPTGPCAPTPSRTKTPTASTPGSTTPTGGSSNNGNSGGSNSGGGSGSGSGAGSSSGSSTPPATPLPASTPLPSSTPVAAKVPVFAGTEPVSSRSATIGLLLLVALISGTALMAGSGVGPRTLLARLRGRGA